MPEDIMIRRNEGYAAIEKHMQEKKISLCTVQAKEVLGDVETLLGLRYSCTYMHSYIVVSACTNEPCHEKTCLREFPTRLDSNWPAQLQKLA